MCTQEALGYVKRLAEEGKLTGDVLDIGALDINGSARSVLQAAKTYVGIDIREGRGVDVVGSSHALPFRGETFDSVVCLEMLEHDSDPFKTLQEIYRVLRPGGWVALTSCYINFPKHNEPQDFWRFTQEGLAALMRDFVDVWSVEHVFNCSVIGHGRKPL